MLQRHASVVAPTDHCKPRSHIARRTAELVLCDSGRICGADDAAVEMFACAHSAMVGLHVSSLLPRLTELSLGDVSSYRRLVYLSHCGAIFNGRRYGGENFACTVSFSQTDSATGHIRRLLVNEVDDTGTYRL